MSAHQDAVLLGNCDRALPVGVNLDKHQQEEKLDQSHLFTNNKYRWQTVRINGYI